MLVKTQYSEKTYCGTREGWSEVLSSHKAHLQYHVDDVVNINLNVWNNHHTLFYVQYQINDVATIPTNSRKSLALHVYRTLYLHKYVLRYSEYMPATLTMPEGISSTRGSTMKLMLLNNYIFEIQWYILFSSETRHKINQRYHNLKTKSLEPFLHTECFHIQVYDGPDKKAPPITMLYSRNFEWFKATGFVVLFVITLNSCANYSIPDIQFAVFNEKPIDYVIKVQDVVNMTLNAKNTCAVSTNKPVFCLYRLETKSDMHINVEVKSLIAEGLNRPGCLYKGLALFNIDHRLTYYIYSQAVTEVLHPLWLVCDHTY